jgi:hypothetical protein
MLKALLGLLVPKKTSGKHLLKQELAKYGVNVSMFPEACLDELVEQSAKIADTFSKLQENSWSVQFVESIEGIAVNIFGYYSGDRTVSLEPDSMDYKILEKYGLTGREDMLSRS